MNLDEWTDFFVATAGASAGLAGLIIVAMSVNIETIVTIPSMPSRAGSTIANLVLVVVVSIAGLIPRLGDTGFGIVALIGSVVCVGIAIESAVQIYRHRDTSRNALAKGAAGVLPAALFLVGSVLLVVGIPSGLDWIAAGILATFVVSVLNAWVLLVEIRR